MNSSPPFLVIRVSCAKEAPHIGHQGLQGVVTGAVAVHIVNELEIVDIQRYDHGETSGCSWR